MALTRESELRLRKAKLIEFFDADPDTWTRIAQRTYKFLKIEYDDTNPREDDVAQALILVLSGNPKFQARLDAKRLTGKLWTRFFAELIIDRKWNQIRGANQ